MKTALVIVLLAVIIALLHRDIPISGLIICRDIRFQCSVSQAGALHCNALDYPPMPEVKFYNPIR